MCHNPHSPSSNMIPNCQLVLSHSLHGPCPEQTFLSRLCCVMSDTGALQDPRVRPSCYEIMRLTEILLAQAKRRSEAGSGSSPTAVQQ